MNGAGVFLSAPVKPDHIVASVLISKRRNEGLWGCKTWAVEETGMVKCPSNAHFRISTKVVGYSGTQLTEQHHILLITM